MTSPGTAEANAPRIKITPIEGNQQQLDGGALFGNAPRSLWTRWHQPDALGRILLACRSALIEDGTHKVLLETGIGAFFPPELADRYGVSPPDRHVLLDNLKLKGVDPGDIDFVVLSHLHFDHAGGMLTAFNPSRPDHHDLAFPNARVLVGRTAWERAAHPHLRDRASFVPALMRLLEGNPSLIIVDDQPPESLAGWLSFRLSHGHTPGQLLSVVSCGSSRLIFAGDLVPGVAWAHLPITMGYDRNAEQVIDEKEELYQWMRPQDLLFFTHDTAVCAAGIELNSAGKWGVSRQVSASSTIQLC